MQVFQHEHIDMSDKLLILLLQKFYKKIFPKLLDMKRKYIFQMDDETAIAMYLYFENSIYNPSSFNDITIKNICNEIERKYA